MKKIGQLLLVAAFALLTGCKSLLPESFDIIRLGIAPQTLDVVAGEGEDGVPVIADRDYQVEILSGADWLKPALVTRDSLSFSFLTNEGFKRMARVRISADGYSDELSVRQLGHYMEWITLSETSLTAPAQGRSVSVRVLSNLPTDYFTVTTTNDEAFSNLSLNANLLTFDVLPTTNRDKRTYTVTVACKDGWGETVSANLTLIQDAEE